MRAVVAEAGSVHVVEMDDPPQDGSVLRVAEAGICGSDLHMVSDGMPRVAMGHEFGVYLPDGRLAAIRPTGSCNDCDPCRRGFQNACRLSWGTAYGIATHGGLADLVAVEDQRIFPMGPAARAVDAALVEPLAISWHGVRRGDPEPGSTALVVGAGSIGLLAVVALRARGVDVHVVARHAHQAAAAEALGATVVDRPATSAYLCTFDAVCTQQTVDLCVKASAPGGKVVEFGMFWTPVQMTNAMMFKEVSIVPAMGYVHAYGSDDFRASADHLSADPLVADTLVTHQFGLDEAAEAFRVAADRASGAIKVHVAP